MSKKTVYPYAEAREKGLAYFMSTKSRNAINTALRAYGKTHGERWEFERLPASESGFEPLCKLSW